ncbi:MAG: prepilin-type N-terminal cleavage/methylation domain-containing protein [Thermoguttaceae bacterium]|nr:prepilin-type N-terminal cleavage/methylation domain-containing protein [Thermoguttaceae bacterium]
MNIRTFHRRSRHGFTLLEVLTAIFVLTFGLLGITAMMQIGGYRAWQATRQAKASYLAEQAFADLQVRGTLKNAVESAGGVLNGLEVRGFVNRSSMVYDPFGERAVIDKSDVRRFSVASNPDAASPRLSSYFSVPTSTGWREMIAGDYGTGNFYDPLRVQPTVSRDDLVWNDKNSDRRPVAEYYTATLDLEPLVSANGTLNVNAVIQASEGRWSWLATIQPLGGRVNVDMNGDNIVENFAYRTNTYEVSVAVYETRSFAAERQFDVEHDSTTDSGINAFTEAMYRKSFRLNPVGTSASERAILKPGHWVALVGKPVPGINTSVGNQDWRVVWFQVVSSQPLANAMYDVQLEGPDLVSLTTTYNATTKSYQQLYTPQIFLPTSDVYLITDPDIVGVVTRTLQVTD